MMFETMFSGNPFGYFENEFEDFDPWTNWNYRTLPRKQYYRPRSADLSLRRNTRRRQPRLSPFWEVPLQHEEEMPTEETTEKKYHTPQRQGGCKCRRKNGCTPSNPKYDSVSRVPMGNERESKKNESNGDEMAQSVQGNSDDSTKYFPPNEKLHEENEEQKNTNPVPTTETINEKEIENPSKDKSEACDMNSNDTTNSEETSEPGKGAEDPKICEIEENEPSEDENTEEQMEGEEESIEEKLKLIELQLTKARELAPKEVLSSPRTDKQKIYLAEMLLRCILDLDSIHTQGNEIVKQTRRSAVREIQSYLDVIENDTYATSAS